MAGRISAMGDHLPPPVPVDYWLSTVDSQVGGIREKRRTTDNGPLEHRGRLSRLRGDAGTAGIWKYFIER
jgi:hypothetical protein